MDTVYYERDRAFNNSGISFSFNTVLGGYHPLHWHEALELLYPLNGHATITIDNTQYNLPTKRIMVIESCQVHSTQIHTAPSMFLCIHLSKKYLKRFMPDIELYQIHCNPNEIAGENSARYFEICEMMNTLTRIYIEDAPAFALEAEGIILQVLARLIRYFSANTAPQLTLTDALTRERIRQIITYTEDHFFETISLDDISKELGLTREYFCRFIKRTMGISYLNYLNEVRLTRVYHDLISTDMPINAIMEKNGITNQKLFNRTFKQLYGATPSAVRKNTTNTHNQM